MVRLINIIFRTRHKWERCEDFPLVKSKFERIDQLIKNKEVLDCGCVGSAINSREDYEKTSHAIHEKHAKYILGVDIWEEEVKKRQKIGCNVICANVETIELNRTFDVVIAADLIEHLPNPGMFLEKANKHLKEGGLLYICTPNAFSLIRCIKALLGIRIDVHQEHTCWYDITTLKQLLERYGFVTKEIYWQDYQAKKESKIILKFRKNLANSIIIITEKSKPVNSRIKTQLRDE